MVCVRQDLSDADRDAARWLDLSHLPMLQCCELPQLEPFYADYPDSGVDYCTESITVHLAAPQLTRLVLFDGFRDVRGLQDSTGLQRLWLWGCVISVPRLVELLAASPLLLDFSWDGWERFSRGKLLEIPVLSTSLDHQRQLAVALSAATQLTALSIAGLSDCGLVEMDSSGVVCKAADHGPSDTCGVQPVPWGRHLQGLCRLQRLELVHFGGRIPQLGEADVLGLTALTALTHLRLTVTDDINDSFGDVFRERMPSLAACSVHGRIVDDRPQVGFVWGTCQRLWDDIGASAKACVSRYCSTGCLHK